MKASNLIVGSIWLLVVGGNVVNTFTISPNVLLSNEQLPWQIVFMPIVVVIGAFMARGLPGERTFGKAIDHQFGLGSYQRFIQALRPELMFSAMAFAIVASALTRELFVMTKATSPTFLGFFTSAGIAFLLAYFIRQRRESVLKRDI
jgi:membrane protein implicated in regulation of membrane protease activity